MLSVSSRGAGERGKLQIGPTWRDDVAQETLMLLGPMPILSSLLTGLHFVQENKHVLFKIHNTLDTLADG